MGNMTHERYKQIALDSPAVNLNLLTLTWPMM